MARTNPPYARGVSQLMYVGDVEPPPLSEPRVPRWLIWGLGALIAWKVLK